VPVPFDCAFACQVKDAAEVERALHLAFGDHRINPNREFFKIDPERVIAVLKLLKVEDITAQLEQTLEADVTAVDRQSAQNLKDARRPRMNFHALGVPTGSVLLFKDGQSQVTVVSDRKVELDGTVCSLTAANRRAVQTKVKHAVATKVRYDARRKRIVLHLESGVELATEKTGFGVTGS
jgi:hypothetical protein